MDYETAFNEAVRRNAASGLRCFVYYCKWTSDYFTSSYLLPMPHNWAIHLGEVGRMTPR